MFAAVGVTSAVAASRSAATPPPAKQAYLDREKALRDQAAARNAALGITKANGPAAKFVPAAGPVLMDPQVPAGDGAIVQSTVAPAGDTSTIVRNRWYPSTGNLTVFAGCDSTVPSEGIVLVTHVPGGQITRIIAPGAHGCLTVVGATGKTLELIATDGFSLRFDADLLQFV